jgi:SAM-dependent methyltransferase
MPYLVWKRLGLFKHGRMENPDYAVGVFRKHLDRVQFARKEGGFVALELGPGDSVASGIVARACGAERSYLVDAGRFAREDLETYRSLLDHLRAGGHDVPTSGDVDGFDQLLASFAITYLTEGLASLREIPDASVDLVWSNAVYEHVRLGEIEELTRELRRVLRPDGVCSHTIDLKDHLGGGANHLRFSPEFWESPRVASAGFYTNRLRASQLVALFERSGFRVEVLGERRWEEDPIARERLATPFRDCSPADLRISDLDLILHPA